MESSYTVIVPTVAAVFALGFWLVAAYHLAGKSGYRPWYGLLTLAPVVNILVLFFWLLDKWPVERQLEQAREQLSQYEARYGPLD